MNHTVSTYRSADPDANVLLYIDNSNMFESAKKYSGHKKGFINGTPDFLCRIDIGRLISRAVRGREVLIGKLYGSEPPALDSVWDAIRKKRVHVETFRRSKVTGKEKELDAALVADAVADIIESKSRAGENRTIIIFSGDRDVLRVLQYAFKYNYTVEICAFQRSINKTVERSAAEEPQKLKIIYIDEFFEEITFHQMLWSERIIPLDRSIVATVNIPLDATKQVKQEFFRAFVQESWNVFHLPIMGKYLDGQFKHIVLIPCVRKREYDSQFNFYKHIQPYMHMLQERFRSVCPQVTSFRQFLDRDKNLESDTVEIVNRYQHLQLTDDDDSELDDEVDEDVLFFDSHSKLSVTALSELDEDEDIIDNVADNKDYQAVSRNKTKAKSNIYSKSCAWKFRCGKGLKCDFKHSEQEREFFKLHYDPRVRKFYKIKPCYHPWCRYNSKSYLCPYAHNVDEARCLSCGGNEQNPHWMDQCPLNNRA